MNERQRGPSLLATGLVFVAFVGGQQCGHRETREAMTSQVDILDQQVSDVYDHLEFACSELDRAYYDRGVDDVVVEDLVGRCARWLYPE